MRGTSQASLERVLAAYEPVLVAAGSEAATLGEQLYAVVDALEGSGSLRRALSDPSRSGDDKAGLVQQLLAGKVDDRVTQVVQAVARARWSAEHDVVDAIEELAAESVLAAAEPADALAQVEDELFRFDRILVGERDLRRAVTDRAAQPEDRVALVRALVGGKVAPQTQLLLERAARAPRGRSLAATTSWLGGLAARRRQRLVATVHVAALLTPPQLDRLGRILERTYGRPVQLNVAVDPDVLGGMRVQVGSEVVDATVLANLEDARRRLAG